MRRPHLAGRGAKKWDGSMLPTRNLSLIKANGRSGSNRHVRVVSIPRCQREEQMPEGLQGFFQVPHTRSVGLLIGFAARKHRAGFALRSRYQ
jgi:hypothetical protein